MVAVKSCSLPDEQKDWLKMMGLDGRGFSKYVQRKIAEDMNNSKEALFKRREDLEKQLKEVEDKIKLHEGQTTLFEEDRPDWAYDKLLKWYIELREGKIIPNLRDRKVKRERMESQSPQDLLKTLSGKQWDANFELMGCTRNEFVKYAEAKYQSKKQGVLE